MYAYLASLGISPFSPECTSVNLVAALGQFCSLEVNEFEQLPRWQRERIIYELADQILLNAVLSMTANPSQVERLDVPSLPGDSAKVVWPVTERLAYLSSCLYFFLPMEQAVITYCKRLTEGSIPASALEAATIVQKKFNDDPEFYSEIIVENKELMKPENQLKDIFWYHSVALSSLSSTEKGRSLKAGGLRDLVVLVVLDSVLLKTALAEHKKSRLRKTPGKSGVNTSGNAEKITSVFKRVISAGKEIPFSQVIALLLQNIQRDELKTIVFNQVLKLDIETQIQVHAFLKKMTSQIIASNSARHKTGKVLLRIAGYVQKQLVSANKLTDNAKLKEIVSAVIYIFVARLSLVCIDHPETALQVGLEVSKPANSVNQ
ncbi:hypothetical protein [Dethiosulfatarculus sandiegensis]|nr:hypothetical protein [Dethiosulfatarculus sandiegensis]